MLIIVFWVHMLCLKMGRKSIQSTTWIFVKLKKNLEKSYFGNLYIEVIAVPSSTNDRL